MELITAETTSAPLPEGFPSEFAVHFHFMKLGFVKAVKITGGSTTLKDAILSVRQKMEKTQSFYGETPPLEEADVLDDEEFEEEPYIVKIKGRAEYVLDTGRSLSRLVYVRKALLRRLKVEFCLITRADMKKELEEHKVPNNMHQCVAANPPPKKKLALESRSSNFTSILQTPLDSIQDDPDAIPQDCYPISEISLPFEVPLLYNADNVISGV